MNREKEEMRNIFKARKMTVGLIVFGLLATGAAVAEANGVWKEPAHQTVSLKYGMEKFCDGHNLIYAMNFNDTYNSSRAGSFQVFRNVTECGGSNL